MKHVAIGVEDKGDGDAKAVLNEGFQRAGYCKLHDAVKEHRYVARRKSSQKNGLHLV